MWPYIITWYRISFCCCRNRVYIITRIFIMFFFSPCIGDSRPLVGTGKCFVHFRSLNSNFQGYLRHICSENAILLWILCSENAILFWILSNWTYFVQRTVRDSAQENTAQRTWNWIQSRSFKERWCLHLFLVFNLPSLRRYKGMQIYFFSPSTCLLLSERLSFRESSFIKGNIYLSDWGLWT